MVQQKKIPKRMCVGCREMKPKRELIRIVLTPEADGGQICIDFKGKKNGRGAYVCRDESCLKKAVKSKALERALSCEIPEEIYANLAEQMKAGGGPA
jgi:predicted RNA-binding protein YlxR (DUF448 family)